MDDPQIDETHNSIQQNYLVVQTLKTTSTETIIQDLTLIEVSILFILEIDHSRIIKIDVIQTTTQKTLQIIAIEIIQKIAKHLLKYYIRE